ncbi:MAG: hypothetical protein DHS80DRAFT_31877 [Piptocephalis tieghemiana]|nr:MAG: hypothetical protein DHS80DRAFT_31877 [Piptocephalis tieghemiana]
MSASQRIKVNGISSVVDTEILRALFSLLGSIEDLQLYPSPQNDGSQEAVISFNDRSIALSALHLTGTQLGDRTLIISILAGSPPDAASQSANPISPSPPIVASGLGTGPYAQMDLEKAEEVARTAYVGNLPNHITEMELLQLFASCGSIVAVKLAGDPNLNSRFAFIEFNYASSTLKAVSMSGSMLGDRKLRINYAKNGIHRSTRQTATTHPPHHINLAMGAASITGKSSTAPPLPSSSDSITSSGLKSSGQSQMDPLQEAIQASKLLEKKVDASSQMAEEAGAQSSQEKVPSSSPSRHPRSGSPRSHRSRSRDRHRYSSRSPSPHTYSRSGRRRYPDDRSRGGRGRRRAEEDPEDYPSSSRYYRSSRRSRHYPRSRSPSRTRHRYRSRSPPSPGRYRHHPPRSPSSPSYSRHPPSRSPSPQRRRHRSKSPSPTHDQPPSRPR